jgi:hypothetical protein
MAATAWRKYESFPEFMGDGTIDMDNDTFKMALFLSTSNAATVTTNTLYSDLTNEHSNANGYTTGGVTLSSVTWSHSTGTTTFDVGDAVWTASGGSIVARFAVIYSSTGGELVAYCILDATPADVTVTTGNTLTVAINASGVFTITGMTA